MPAMPLSRNFRSVCYKSVISTKLLLSMAPNFDVVNKCNKFFGNLKWRGNQKRWVIMSLAPASLPSYKCLVYVSSHMLDFWRVWTLLCQRNWQDRCNLGIVQMAPLTKSLRVFNENSILSSVDTAQRLKSVSFEQLRSCGGITLIWWDEASKEVQHVSEIPHDNVFSN